MTYLNLALVLGVIAPRSDVKANSSPSACIEDPIVLVNFSSAPVYNNQVFTRGFTFFLEWADSEQVAIPRTERRRFERNIELAFGTALTQWTAGLLKIKSSLDEALKAYLSSALSCSTSYCVLAPPQVKQVRCIENGMFRVKVYAPGGPPFPVSGDGIIAAATVEGRTILINATKYRFNYDLKMKTVRAGGRMNLLWVMTHELGHSFGLGHPDDDRSVMKSVSVSLRPSDGDVQRFAMILKQTLAGSAAGVFDPSACAGLRVVLAPGEAEQLANEMRSYLDSLRASVKDTAAHAPRSPRS